jgi:hypothetical protein
LPDTGLEQSGEAGLPQVQAAESAGESAIPPLVHAPAIGEAPDIPPVPDLQKRPPETELEQSASRTRQKPAKPAEPAAPQDDSPLVSMPQTAPLHGMDISLSQNAGMRTALLHEEIGEPPDPGRADHVVRTAGPGGIDPAAGSASRRREAAQSSKPLPQPPAPLVRAHPGNPKERAPALNVLPSSRDTRDGAEPSIHVTIGRVEVRAHTSPPKPAPRPAAPRAQEGLSLQDYLKHGGKPGGRP